jgi:hypothetical protein
MLHRFNRLRNLLFVSVVLVYWSAHNVDLRADSHLCSDVCDETVACDQECFDTLLDIEVGHATTCLAHGDSYDVAQYCCGDYLCSGLAGETGDGCAADCGPGVGTVVCGDSYCSPGETCAGCPSDCGSCGPAGSSCNNDGVCDTDEDETCQDCMRVGFCHSDSDCPSVNGRTYVCAGDQCVLQELPWVSNTCRNNDDCDYGWTCRPTDVYDCPNNETVCYVCVPPWVH